MAPRPERPRTRLAFRSARFRSARFRSAAFGLCAVGLCVVAASCSSGSVAPTPVDPDGGGIATTALTTTTLQDLDDLVNATDRPPLPTSPAGYGAAADATGQVSAVAAMLRQRDGAFAGEPGVLIDAIAQEVLASFTGCDVAPTVLSSTTGVGPAIGTIDVTFGCDPTTDGLEYVVTMEAPGSPDNPSDSWVVTAATRSPHCTNGVLDGLCV